MGDSRGPIQPVTVFRGHECAVQCASFHPTLDLLASGDSEGVVKLWNVETRRPVLSEGLVPYSKGVLRVACVDESLIVQAREGVVQVWDLEGSRLTGASPQFEVETGYYGFCKMGYTEQHCLGIPGRESGCVEIWNARRGEKMGVLTPQEDLKLGMCMAIKMWTCSSGEGKIALIGYESGSIAAWDTRFTSKPMCLKPCFPEPVLSLDISPDKMNAVAGGANRNIVRLALQLAEAELKVDKILESLTEGSGTTRFRQDGKIFATGGWDGKIRIWKWRSCKPLAVLKYHTKEVAELDFEAKSTCLVSASRDGNLCLWSLYPPTSNQLHQDPT